MTALGLDDRRSLLALARSALDAHVRGTGPPEPGELPPALAAPSGAFVTLTLGEGRELCGCVGFVEPRRGLAETVMSAARAAADDRRFPAVEPARLDAIRIEISVLGPLTAVRPEDVVAGVHGLVVKCDGRSGLLLPQVATEHGLDREGFLAQTCRKAGLPADAWRRPDTEIHGFTAEVFRED